MFLGPSCVLTNVTNPRSQVNRHSLYETTLLRRGCTIGANATIVCGVTVGRYAFVAPGAVVTKDVPDYALVVGNPGQADGLDEPPRPPARTRMPTASCVAPRSGYRYQEGTAGVLRCLDLDEEAPLPAESSRGDDILSDNSRTGPRMNVPLARSAGAVPRPSRRKSTPQSREVMESQHFILGPMVAGMREGDRRATPAARTAIGVSSGTMRCSRA